jgi:hypothetical protein
MAKRSSLLPSKKFLTSLGIVVILVVVIVILPRIVREKKFQSTRTFDDTVTFEVTVGDIVDNDADKDGLEDWEEALWGTNPLDPDTDGDGILDGAEIAEIRNALASSIVQETNEEGVTHGEAVARQLFATYSLLDVQGGLTDEVKTDLSATLAEELTRSLLTSPITSADLSTVKETETTFITYAQNIENIFLSFPVGKNLIVDIIQELSTKGVADSHRNTALDLQSQHQELLRMNVVESALIPHTNVTNSFGELALAFELLTSPDSDPLLVFQAFTQIESIFENTFTAMASLGSYFEQQARVY